MDRRYKHLNGEERGVILAEHRRGASLQAIGLLLGRSASTIGRELLRGRTARADRHRKSDRIGPGRQPDRRYGCQCTVWWRGQ